MTQKEIEALEHKEYKEKRLIYGEGGCRSMIMSCLIYGYGRDYFYKNHAQRYEAVLGQERVEEIWEDQYDYFINHCKVNHNVYTDSEGCTYNSVTEF
jgi:hypothetical protein